MNHRIKEYWSEKGPLSSQKNLHFTDQETKAYHGGVVSHSWQTPRTKSFHYRLKINNKPLPIWKIALL